MNFDGQNFLTLSFSEGVCTKCQKWVLQAKPYAIKELSECEIIDVRLFFCDQRQEDAGGSDT